jgi:pyruvate kinase
MISKYRPEADILAITFDEKVQRSLTINWGVHPIISKKPSTTDEMFELATREAVASGIAEEGDLILITAGVPVGERGTTNVMKIQLIGNKILTGQGVGTETVVGNAVVATSVADAKAKAVEGAILVVPTTNPSYLPAMEKASAIIVEQGGLTSHAAVVGIAKHIPVIVSAKNATKLISEGQKITVDPRRGIVYNGEVSAI